MEEGYIYYFNTINFGCKRRSLLFDRVIQIKVFKQRQKHLYFNTLNRNSVYIQHRHLKIIDFGDREPKVRHPDKPIDRTVSHHCFPSVNKPWLFFNYRSFNC